MELKVIKNYDLSIWCFSVIVRFLVVYNFKLLKVHLKRFFLGKQSRMPFNEARKCFRTITGGTCIKVACFTTRIFTVPPLYKIWMAFYYGRSMWEWAANGRLYRLTNWILLHMQGAFFNKPECLLIDDIYQWKMASCLTQNDY